ncbi:MAG: hypothetical protein EXQ92_06735 [Alphaproteobacteria bacterium]|nr:hypothetical protein [Alphaproteobacteria bacterium]
MEAVVPNSDSGGRGYLVLPFAKVPELTQLDARDSALQYEIKAASTLNAPDRFVLRTLRLKVDFKHGATDAIKTAAERDTEVDKAERFRIRLALIAQLTRDCGTRMGDRFMASASTERLLEFVQKKEIGGISIDVDELTKRVVQLTGQAIGAPPADVEKRLERLVELAAPFGTPGVPAERKTDGFLIRQRHGLAGLVASLKGTRPEIRATAIGAIDKAEPRVIQTLDFVDERLNAVDGLFANLARALKDWDMTLSRLQQARRSVG